MNEHSVVLRLAAGNLSESPLVGRVWRERLPYPPDDPLAHRLRDREATRALAAGATLRVTEVTYRDGTVDLVAVADRDTVPQARFFELVESLVGQSLPRGGWQLPELAAGPPQPPEWGVPDAAGAGFGNLSVDAERLTNVGADHLVEAVRATATRYGDDNGVGVIIGPAVAGFEYRAYLTPPLPMTVTLAVDGDQLRSLTCQFDASAIHPAIADQFLRHVLTVAEQVAAGTEATKAELLGPAEAAQLVAAGASDPPGNPPLSITEAFGQAATRYRDRPAVSDPDRVLTYGELDELSAGYADGLRRLGVGRGDFVGVCLERTVELVAVMLGVLRAGGAYVPLNGHDPAPRLSYIATDAGLRLIIGDAAAVEGVRTIRPDEVLVGPSTTPAPSPTKQPTVDDAAYVIYTSGSTGRPKGVVVPHRNVHALIAATAQDLDLGPADVWTLFHAASFDFSVWEIWGCLLTGGRLIVVPYLVSRSPEEFYDLVVAQRVTVLSQTPSAFANLQQVDARRELELRLRLVVFGGESLDPASLRGWVDRHPLQRCRLVNMFGITETTVHVTTHDVTGSDIQTNSRRVGRALPGWSVSVRDGDGAVLPMGVAGELYVGGAGVAREYLNRPELTAARFLRAHADGRLDADGPYRVYRSGDRGRLRPDGTIDHLGRLDSQVKVRGFRIELDEIRSVLQADDAVSSAAVIVAGDATDPGGTRIHAYVVTIGGAADLLAIRRRAAQFLPEYMLPSTITAIATLPLTGNGKLDVAALPPPGAPPVEAGATRPSAAAAQTAAGLPATVARVWAQIVGAPTAGATDFFEQGGNSLLAVRLVAALQEAGLPPISVRDIYRHRTAERLTELVATRTHITSTHAAPSR